MNDLEKLRVMLPHWIEHNDSHGTEFAQWAEKLAGTDIDISDLLYRAVSSLEEVRTLLEQALAKAGGPLDAPHHSHHHHH